MLPTSTDFPATPSPRANSAPFHTTRPYQMPKSAEFQPKSALIAGKERRLFSLLSQVHSLQDAKRTISPLSWPMQTNSRQRVLIRLFASRRMMHLSWMYVDLVSILQPLTPFRLGAKSTMPKDEFLFYRTATRLGQKN